MESGLQPGGSHLNALSLFARMQGGEEERPPVQGAGEQGGERCPSVSLARKVRPAGWRLAGSPPLQARGTDLGAASEPGPRRCSRGRPLGGARAQRGPNQTMLCPLGSSAFRNSALGSSGLRGAGRHVRARLRRAAPAP